ncbi:hypothetical protein MHUMG1_07152 [Metarhizium humberi]|uniref:Uncharacterized protein n=1 Tax=Metarhizium humberi TaxID=2596975 RepID=A0A9P8M6A5_9HYPO|nr:hypothetical protein MHUMG1_07152 [Metarhizium humberi]
MEDDEHAARSMSRIKLEDGITNGQPEAMDTAESTPTHGIKGGASPASINGIKSESDGVNTPASGKPRLSRRSSQKPAEPETRLFNHLPNVTEESCKSFQVIRDCLYGSKHLGSTDNDALDCDCAEEFQSRLRRGGILYAQIYSLTKEIIDAARTYPFQNSDLRHLALNSQLRNGVQNICAKATWGPTL